MGQRIDLRDFLPGNPIGYYLLTSFLLRLAYRVQRMLFYRLICPQDAAMQWLLYDSTVDFYHFLCPKGEVSYDSCLRFATFGR